LDAIPSIAQSTLFLFASSSKAILPSPSITTALNALPRFWGLARLENIFVGILD
jgi:hypothetical protein